MKLHDEILDEQNHNKLRIDIKNVMNFQYLGKVFIGTYENGEATPGTVVFDTGSNWLTMTSDKCTNCTSKVYDSEHSTTNTLVQDEVINQLYGSANLTGYEYNDTVCLQPA